MRRKLYDKIVKHILENQDKFYRIVFSYVHNKEGCDLADSVNQEIYDLCEQYTDEAIRRTAFPLPLWERRTGIPVIRLQNIIILI